MWLICGLLIVLALVAIGATLLEDDDEMTPLELAIVSDTPMSVVELLQKATQKATMESSLKRSNDKRRLLEDEATEIQQGGAKRRLVDGASTGVLRRSVVF